MFTITHSETISRKFPKFSTQSIKTSFTGLLSKFTNDRSGTIAPMFGLMAMAMFMFMGAAIDYSRWLHARNQTLAAIDAAVLAAGRSLQVAPGDVELAMAAADRYYTENIKSRIPLLRDTIAFKTEDNDLAVTAEGEAFIETTILKLAHIDEIALFELSGAEFSKSVVGVGGNSGTNLEVSLMLDTSSSMDSNNKFQDMQAAAADLINIIVWEDQSSYTSKVAIAPFSADVRVPASIVDAVRGTGLPAQVSYNYTCGKKKCAATYQKTTACVAERKGTQKYTDAAPGAGQYVMAAYASGGTCSQPEADAIAPLSSNKSELMNKIGDLEIGSGTAGHLGTAWAWYMLSPEWNTIWPDSEAAAYGAEKTQKIAILMTDGEYNLQYDANGVKTGASGAGAAVNGSSNYQARALCDGMKEKGITVYTVGFDLGGNQTAIDTLRYCATDTDKFYNAEDGAELKQSFRDIALQLSTLHLTR